MFAKRKFNLNFNTSLSFHNFIALIGMGIASILLFRTLFTSPMPGVADQGDFYRVMSACGLEQMNNSTLPPGYHWFRYVVTEYKTISATFKSTATGLLSTSIFYPVAVAKIFCFFLGKNYFSTKVLAFVYSFLYIVGLYICFKAIPFKRAITAIFFILAACFILVDGNYLVWFNSLYGEPMMIVSLLLFISSILHFSRNTEEIHLKSFFYIFATIFLFLGAKMQCFSALPFILLFIIRIAFLQNYRSRAFKQIGTLLAGFSVILVIYVAGIYVHINGTCGMDTQFNSVFYGILKNSSNPKKDLAVLGLPPGLAVEAGKHAYLPKNQYTKYIPWSELTKNEFNKRMTNLKLLHFYLTQPSRLLQGMKYTASQCFNTGGSLGKYEISEINQYTPNLKSAAPWSDFRNSKLPKNLFFLIFFYSLVFFISFLEYKKQKKDKAWRLRIELLWLVLAIGMIQFPMPYIGNGEADTAKQLFLYNYTFDIAVLVSCTWFFDKVVLTINRLFLSH